MRRFGTALVVVALVATAAPAALAAGGGRPLFQERFDDRFVEDPDPFPLDACGVEVRTEFHFWGSFTLYPDMSARSHVNDHIVSSDPATGEVLLVERSSSNVFSEPAGVARGPPSRSETWALMNWTKPRTFSPRWRSAWPMYRVR